MSCLVTRNNQGNITNIKVSNGENSQAFEKLYSIPFTGTSESVYKIFTNLYSDKVEKMFEGIEDTRFVYENSLEPRIFLKDSAGNLVENIETSIINNNIGVFEIGVINPQDSSFIKIASFNSQQTEISKGITDGIETGTVSPNRVLTKNGELKFKGKGIYSQDIKATVRLFKQDFESATGIRVKTYPDGTLDIQSVSNFVIIDSKNSSQALSKQDALEFIKTNKSVTNKAQVILASTDYLSKPYNTSITQGEGLSEKAYLKMLNSFTKSLGFSTTTLESYKNTYKTRHGEVPGVSALVDLNNKVIAIAEGSNSVENMTEEVVHLAIEAYSDQDSILGAIVDIDTTPEYNKWASIYREKYAPQYPNNESALEDAVRKEILGKVITRNILENNFTSVEAENIWTRFVNYLRSIFKPSQRTSIDKITKDITDSLKSGDTSYFGRDVESEGVFYSLEKSNNEISDSIKDTIRLIDSLATLSERHGSRGVRATSEKNIPKILGDYDLISSVKNITDTIESNLKELSIKLRTNNISPIDYIRAETFKGIVDKNLNTLASVVEAVSTESLIPARDGLLRNIETLTSQSARISTQFKNVNSAEFDKLIDEIISNHNLTQEEGDNVRSLFVGTMKDISRINSTWGLISESSNPLLSVLAKLISDLKVTTTMKSQKEINRLLDLADKKGWTSATIQEGILEKDDNGKLTGYVETALLQGKLDENERTFILDEISSHRGVDLKEAEKLYDTKDLEDIFDTQEAFQNFQDKKSVWDNENLVRMFLDEEYEEREEMDRVANVSEATKESMREDRRTINSIRNDANYIQENGEIDRTLMTEEDRFTIDNEMSRLKSKKSPIDQNLDVRYGLKLVKVSDLSQEEIQSLPYYGNEEMKKAFTKALENQNRNIVIPTMNLEELPFESRYALDNFNLNFARQLKFSTREKSKASSNYVQALRELENKGDFDEALDFAKENGSIVFTDAYYDQLSGNESYSDYVRSQIDDIEGGDKTIVEDLLSNLNNLSSRRSEFLKSYRSSRDITEINAGDISNSEREAFKIIEGNISEVKRDINKKLKKYGIETPIIEQNNDFILDVNESFRIETISSGKSSLDFAISEMSEQNANDVLQFRAYVQQQVANKNTTSDKKYDSAIERIRNSENYSNILTTNNDVDFVNAITFEYAKTRLPAFYKKQTPTEWADIETKILDGKIKLSDLTENDLSLGKYITIQPDYSWVDLSYNRNKVNPEYKKSFGGRQPKMSKYRNQAWFDKYGITDEEWQNAQDITELTAKNNQNQFEYNQTMISLRKESDALYGYRGNIYQAIQQSNSFWQKVKSSTKSGGLKSGLKDALSDIIIDKVDELQYGEALDGTISGMEAVRVPPTFFRKKIEDQNSITRDTLSAYALDFVKANEYQSRVEMTGKFYALMNKASESKFSDSSIIKSKKKIVKEGQTSEVYKRLKDGIDSNLYGVKQSRRLEYDFMGKRVDLTRVIDRFRKLSVFTNLGFNPLVSATSFTTGVVNNIVDRLSGGVYSQKAQNDANKYLLQDSTKYVSQDGKLTVNSRLNTLMETFGMKDVQQRFNESASSRFSRIFTESAFKLDEYANLAVVPRVLYSTLFDHRLVISRDNDGKDIYRILSFDQFKNYANSNGMTTKAEVNSAWGKTTAFFDLLDTKDGTTSPTTEYLKYFTEEDFKKHVSTIGAKAIQQNQRVDGMITDIDRSPAQRDAFLNLVMQHKSWFPVVMSQQFKKSGFNFIRGRYEEGYVKTGADFLFNLAKNYRNPVAYYQEWMTSATDQQKANLKRAVTMSSVLVSLIALSFAFAGTDDEDDPFAEDFARIITYRTLGEVQGSSLLGLYGSAKGVLESPVTALTTFDAQYKLLKQIGSPNSDRYKEKVWEKFLKITPFKRISQLTDLHGYTHDWLFFNKESLDYEFLQGKKK